MHDDSAVTAGGNTCPRRRWCAGPPQSWSAAPAAAAAPSAAGSRHTSVSSCGVPSRPGGMNVQGAKGSCVTEGRMRYSQLRRFCLLASRAAGLLRPAAGPRGATTSSPSVFCAQAGACKTEARLLGQVKAVPESCSA